ncbi:hypothetical protein J6590_070047 [Homalodisca vitripennis]|nr:hypothetical protein J6590_070047 [Homalodisca vitripennis]
MVLNNIRSQNSESPGNPPPQFGDTENNITLIHSEVTVINKFSHERGITGLSFTWLVLKKNKD